MEQDIGEFVDENEVRKVLGMDSENIESHWGHKEIKEQYHDNIENIDISLTNHEREKTPIVYQMCFMA